jgi:3-isopropylmalate dehydratase small subunit
LRTSTQTRSFPARFLKATSREGFGKNLFRDWRFENDDESKPKKDFPLNDTRYSGKILVTARNFGSALRVNMRRGRSKIMDLMW